MIIECFSKSNQYECYQFAEGPLSIDSNGVVTLAGNTPSGSYSITYELCEVNLQQD
jgi:hypothetical protein